MNALECRADKLWAQFILNRDGCCVVGQADDHRNCWGRLEAHHLFRRSKSKATRWDPRNGASLCAFHHGDMHAHPLQHAVWREEYLGPVTHSELLRKTYGGSKPDVAAIVDQLRVGAEEQA